MLSRNKVGLTEVGPGVKYPSLKGRAIVFETMCIGSIPMGGVYGFWNVVTSGRTFALQAKDVGSSPTISKARLA